MRSARICWLVCYYLFLLPIIGLVAIILVSLLVVCVGVLPLGVVVLRRFCILLLGSKILCEYASDFVAISNRRDLSFHGLFIGLIEGLFAFDDAVLNLNLQGSVSGVMISVKREAFRRSGTVSPV